MDKCFRTIAKTHLREPLLNLMGTSDNWGRYYYWDALAVPRAIIDSDPTLAALREKREFKAGILKAPANSCYMWHVDADRRCGINMLLRHDGQSRCLFTPKMGIVVPTVELKYEPDTLYAFNTKILHTVLNFSEPRYVLSIEFIGKDEGLPYAQLCTDLGLT